MARAKKAAADVTPASSREVREWLLGQSELPEGVTVAQRGRFSAAAKAYFTEQTGRPIAEAPVAVAAE